MSPRTPKSRDRRYRTSLGAPVDLTAEVETPVGPYPLRRGGRAVPDRSQPPDIGAACHETRKSVPAPAFTEENRSGVELPSTKGNAEVQKTSQEFGDDRRESRGVRTRPPRPGRHWRTEGD